MGDKFSWPCPACGTTNRMHEFECKHEYRPYHAFELRYTDILAVLLDAGEPISYQKLRAGVDELPRDEPWIPLHDECLEALTDRRRVLKEGGRYRVPTPDERSEQVIPLFEPLRTIYEYGPVDGCKDYAVYTMMSWCNLKDLTWPQARNFMREWLTDTNAWERESWGESSIEELVNSKKHVWSGDFGWGGHAEAAKNTIDHADVPKSLDATKRAGREAEDYD